MANSKTGPHEKNRLPEFGINRLSQDPRLDKLLKTVVSEVKLYAEDQIRHIKMGADIGNALSVHSDINILFEKIVDHARAMSNADGGTLFTMDKERKNIQFRILQNMSMGIRMGGTSDYEITLPDIPLYIEGERNYSNVASYVAITGKTVNIADMYDYKGFDFSGTRRYDQTTGYQSKSLLVTPLKDHENKIIGVLQLLNAQDPQTGRVVRFSPEYEEMIKSLASQAAVALTNTTLIQELKNLNHAFIESIATAIDEKSRYTGHHIRRVVDLTMMIAKKINQTAEGPLANIVFTEDQMEELRLAAWMHDVGKITTPEAVINKATKLETIFDRICQVRTRFQLIAASIENKYLRKKIEIMNRETDKEELEILDLELEKELESLKTDLNFIEKCNESAEFMGEEDKERIAEIAGKRYALGDVKHPYLEDDEVKNLCIRRGTLTEEERDVIETHAKMTLKILEKIPFPSRLENVPIYAAGHHLKPDGSGYPRELRTKELPIQSRIMAIADIFEALTARDRPYKKPMQLSKAVRILGFLKKDNHIDSDIFNLFIESGLYKIYARNELDPAQIDE